MDIVHGFFAPSGALDELAWNVRSDRLTDYLLRIKSDLRINRLALPRH